MTIRVEMKHLIAACVIFWTCAYPAISRTLYEYSSVAKAHEKWMSQYGRSYADDVEREKRFKIFMENLEYIEKFNSAKNNSYTLGLNQFSDLTEQEFISSFTGLNTSRLPNSSSSATPLNQTDIPESLDWRDKGAVTDIKSQGICGCCWAFSTVAAVEGLVKIKTDKLISLSEQQVLDCDRDSNGCRGGVMDYAFNYMKNEGVTTETNYPYQAIQGTCQSKMKGHAVQISGYKDVVANSEEQLLQAVANQPVTVSIATNNNFRSYKEGIFAGPCGNDHNHAVTVIGYGTSEDTTKYWLIKNSWSVNWGENGYMRLQRESGEPGGVCGVAVAASYPIL